MESLSLVVSPLLQVVYEQLISRNHGELLTRGHFRKEVKKLREMLPTIQAVMEEAEERQLNDKEMKIWLSKLKDVAYDADDLLDEISTIDLRKAILKADPGPFRSFERWYSEASRSRWSRFVERMRNEVWRISLTLESIQNYFKLPSKLKEIRERLDATRKEMERFQFRDDLRLRRSDTSNRRETGPHVDQSEVYGRKKDADKIVDMLLSSSYSKFWVIPIVGMGGIGKTTLVQLVYNDERLERRFDLKMWLSVYNNFSKRRIVNAMLEYVTKNRNESSQIGVLENQLMESLCGKRYLLVLDDVWNEDRDEWDKVRSLLRGGADGSKIIITTRNEKVASIMTNTPPYVLGTLTDDDCWTLFKQRAFADGEEDAFPNLLPIGKQIADKCKGVPLAAKVVGSLMRFKREESEWLSVQGSELWNLDEGKNRILSVLRLSFNHLPSHLKRCFHYCAVFPKNFGIHKEKLIQQWIAGGLIQFPTDQQQPRINPPVPEDVGNEYFKDLLWMSLFQGPSRCGESSITEFKMHDLIHDLAKSVAGNEFWMLGNENQQTSLVHGRQMPVVCDDPFKPRHACVDCNFESEIPEALYEAKQLRTLYLLSTGVLSQKALNNMILHLKHLRILKLSGSGIKKLPRFICHLTGLRYLDLSNNPIQLLPMTFCDLCKLQTLDLQGCNNLLRLPRRMADMIGLVHLNIKNCARLTHMPTQIGKLVNLRTLPIFIVGSGFFHGSLFDLLNLSQLQGELEIKRLENVTKSDLYRDSTHFLHGIHSLKLAWGDDDADGKLNQNRSRQRSQILRRDHSVDVEVVITLLRPDSNIRRLSINGYLGIEFPCWFNVDTLSNLTHLELINCRRCEKLPTLGYLPVLEVLNIQGMDDVVSIGKEFFGPGRSSFPSLNELSIRDFLKLKTWESVDSTEVFTRLKRLTIANCPLLAAIPFSPSLQHLEMCNCDPLLLRSAAELRSISSLVIDSFPGLTFISKALLGNCSLLLDLTVKSCPKLDSLPESLGKLTTLRSLKIAWCEELKTLPGGMRNLASLENLEIIECPSLISLPGESIGGLSSLRTLSIENCNGLTSLPDDMQRTTALEHLTVMYCANLASLPDGLKHLSALRSLTIISCPNLAALPEGLQHVKALESLEIRSCPSLMELPMWTENLVSLRSLAISDCQNVKSLPDGFQRLNALQHLSITGCPDVEKRCEKGKGEDWKKISHIPFRYIG